MVKGQGVSDSVKKVRQFYIVGRKNPTEAITNQPLYRMRVFARDEVLAKSKFWYFMKRQHKVRRVQGEIVSVSEIFEKAANSIKNYGVVIRYLTRTINVNMYKEYRDVSLCGAVSQMYSEMSGRHSARAESIQIIKTSIVANSDLRRKSIIQYTSPKLRFPKVNPTKRAPCLARKTTFKASRPVLV